MSYTSLKNKMRDKLYEEARARGDLPQSPREEIDERRKFYDDLGEQYRDVPNDPATAERAAAIFDVRNQEVTGGEMDASRASAAGYSRRGLSGSGYATGSQSQVIQAAADERSRVRAAALDQAVGEGRTGILTQANISGKGDALLQQLLAAHYAQEAAREADDAASRDEYRKLIAGGAGTIVGAGKGGPAGAAAGVGLATAGSGQSGAPPYYLQDPEQYPVNYYDPNLSFIGGY